MNSSVNSVKSANPIYSIEKEKEIPICIVAVIEEYPNSEIHSIREYAVNEGLTFKTRIYQPYEFSEDRHYIERLPAFHIYRKSSSLHYMKTFYMNSNYVKEIDTVVQKTHKKDSWKKRFAKLLGRA